MGGNQSYFSSEGDYSALERRKGKKEKLDKAVRLCLQFKLEIYIVGARRPPGTKTKLFKGVEFIFLFGRFAQSINLFF